MARQASRSIAPLVPQQTLDTLMLLVTEVVCNGVRHAQAPGPNVITLDLWLFDDVLRVEVRDRGRGFEHEEPDEDETLRPHGWGLVMVDRLAEAWGVEGEDTTLVWFELDPLAVGERRLERSPAVLH